MNVSHRALRCFALVISFAACQGPAGPEGPPGKVGAAGLQGADGLAGEAGAAGQNGKDGADGSDGTDGKDGRDADGGVGGEGGAASECEWCEPSINPACTPDTKSLQHCVDDGNGCGHWELVQHCDNGCGYVYGAGGDDSLGNPPAGGYACKAPPAADTCLADTPCDEGKTCNTGGACEPADSWLVATATLHTAFDGVTHSFSALSEELIVSCSGGGGTYWDSSSQLTCELIAEPLTWTADSAGSDYAGSPISTVEFVVFAVTATGPQTADCTGKALDATLFSSTLATCTINITSSQLTHGGYVQGTFSRTDQVTGHGEVANASSFLLSGSFRGAIK